MRRVVLVAGLALALPACGGPAAATHPEGATARSPVELTRSSDRPSLTLVTREGDPFGAVGVAIAHDRGATASVWLSALVDERLAAARITGVVAQPSAAGVVLRARLDDVTRLAPLLRATREVLAANVTPADHQKVAARVRAAPHVRAWASPADRAIGECSGELGDAPRGQLSIQALEDARRAAFSAGAAAVAVVGPRALTAEGSRALSEAGAWPESPGPDDPWPAADVAGVSAPDVGPRALSVALRIPSAPRAVEAARTLGAVDSALVQHLRALEPAWRVERVVATTRPRGACLRLDLSTADGTPATPLVADVAALAAEEAERAVALAPGDAFSLEGAVLEASDPREAASIAAWRALAAAREGGPLRTAVSRGVTEDPAREGEEFAAALAAARAARRTPSVEVVAGSEPGQGEVWALLGSPCASAAESARDAGIAALAVRALSMRTPVSNGVRVEPWISGEGVGLLVHGPRRDRGETDAQHAERVGEVLGRVAAGAPLTGDDAVPARQRLLSELDRETHPLWPVTLSALSPARPSLLDPRGTWQSISELSTPAVEVERRALVRGPLRLAVLGNGGSDQAALVERGARRWLRPERASAPRCAPVAELPGSPGEYSVDAPAGADGGRAIVAVTLPGTSARAPALAEWTAHLLNRPGGWLDRSLRVPGLALQAEAIVLGGTSAGALAVELAVTGPDAREAAAQVRALFARLSEGAITTEDVALARAAATELEEHATLDPRHRLVRRWLERGAAPPPDLATLRRFHHEALDPRRHVVVLTRVRR